MYFSTLCKLKNQVPADPRKAMRILCICLEPTLSAATMKHFGYSTRSCCTAVTQHITCKMANQTVMYARNVQYVQ